MAVDYLFELNFTASPPTSTQIHSIERVCSIQSVQSMGVDELFALKFTAF